MTFGEKLKLLRYEKGLTQDDLGYILNVSKSCVSCYEKGSRQPSIDVLITLSVFFRVTVDFLVGIEPYDPNGHEKVKINKKDAEFISALKDKPILYKNILADIPNFILKVEEIYE